MAACVGVQHRRASTPTPSRWAPASPGLAGVRCRQIGNVGPDLGQSYIVDSFMVVVLGGVGQLAGTVYAALGLGVAEQAPGRLWAARCSRKIVVLVFIIFFIQKRPQGMFALKGRSAGGMTKRMTVPTAATPPQAGCAPLPRRRSALVVVAWCCAPRAQPAWCRASNPFHVSTTRWRWSARSCATPSCALAMDLIWGYAGILSLGHGLFFALGGYAHGHVP